MWFIRWTVFVLSTFTWAALPEERVDVVVLGGGVGGLTSAVYLARSGHSVTVIEGAHFGGAIAQSQNVENWPGEISISGLDLIDKIRIQAETNGAVLSREEVISVDFSSVPLKVEVRSLDDLSISRVLLADACIVAMGTKTNMLGVFGEDRLQGKGVFTCAVCDGSLYKDKVVAVVGGGDAAVLEADYLSGIAKKVFVFVRKKALKGIESKRREALSRRPNVEIVYNTVVKEIRGSERVEAVEIDRNGIKEQIALDAVFLAIGAVPNTQLFEGKLELNRRGYLVQKNGMETSVAGVFAVGDIAADSEFKQAVTASGDGAKAAIQAQMFLSLLKEAPLKEASIVQIDKVLEVKSYEHLEEIVRTHSLPVLVDFYATWCPPCRGLAPFLEKSAQKLKGKAIVCKVNVDTAHELVLKYNIHSMPTVLHIDPLGREVLRKIGPTDIKQYIEQLDVDVDGDHSGVKDSAISSGKGKPKSGD